MKYNHQIMSPQDVVILLKIIAINNDEWQQVQLADELGISQSEISKSIVRSKYAGLIDVTGKKVFRAALLDFLKNGIAYVFPQRPGQMVKGVPTAHSAAPLNDGIVSNEHYVWPSARGKVRGQAIAPLYPSVVKAVENDSVLYELLALVDALRVGKAREKNLAIQELQKRFFQNGKPDIW
ncbi:MAG: hypothetical protein CML16_18095 [Pusillimonas sp.]|nr:hypothetical protein [Pusillimonas sp.]